MILLGTAFPALMYFVSQIGRWANNKAHEKKEGLDLPTILYLRSFNTDGKNDVEAEPSPFSPLAAFVSYKFGTSHEVDLANQLTNFAHLITIGNPTEDFPEMGFKRIYCKDIDWKEKVKELIISSDVIIYRPNLTDSLFWELDQVIDQNAMPKLVIWNLAGDEHKEYLRKAIYNAFRRKINELYKILLPEYNNKNRYIFFNDNGEIDSTHYIRFERKPDKSVRIFK